MTVKYFFKEYSWAMYLGFILQYVCKYSVLNWEFWIIVVPLALLVSIKDIK